MNISFFLFGVTVWISSRLPSAVALGWKDSGKWEGFTVLLHQCFLSPMMGLHVAPFLAALKDH